MRQQRHFVLLMMLLVFAVGGAANGAPRPASAAEAIPLIESACVELARDLGDSHARVGACLMELVRANAEAGRIENARETAMRAIAIVKAAFPRERYGAALFHLGETFKTRGDGDTALYYFGLAAQVYGPMDLHQPGYLVATLTEIADIYHDQSHFAEAASLFERVLVSQRVDGKMTDPGAASVAYLLADCYSKLGDFDKALVLLAEVTTMLTTIEDESHASSEDLILRIAAMQKNAGDAGAALASSQYVIERLKDKDNDYARIRKARAFELSARIYDEHQQLVAAREAYDAAIKLATGISVDNEGVLASAIADLGFHLLRRGRYAEARARLDDALALIEKAQGSDSPNAGMLLEQTAVALLNADDQEQARPIAAKAVAIYRKLAPQSRSLIRAMKISAYCTKEETSRSKTMSEALALQREVTGEFEPDYLLDTARQQKQKGNVDRAIAYAEAALAIEPDNATTLTTLADMYKDRGDFGRAITLARESIAVTAKRYGSGSVNVAARQFNLGQLLVNACDRDGARVTFLTAADLFRTHTASLFVSLSLAEQRQLLPRQAATQISSVLSVCSDDPCVTRAYELIVSWKGFLIDGLSRQTAIARALESETSDVARRWKVVRTQLAEWQSARGSRPYDEWKQKNDALAVENETLQRSLLQNRAGDVDAEVTLDDLRRVLRDGEIFVDIFKYDKYTHEPTRSRYGAVLLGKTGAPAFVDLDAKRVEAAVSAWRTAIATESDKPWARVVESVWEPIRAALPAVTQDVHVSPDGELAKLPWHAFEVDGRLRVVEIDSARFLVRARRKPRPAGAGGGMLLAGGIDYDAGRTKQSPGQPGKPFPALHWATQEAQTISQLAERNRITVSWLRGNEATKQAVLDGIDSVRYVHLATHAYVSGEPAIGLRGRGWEIGGPPEWSRNVLVDTGVALSGANVRDPQTLTTAGTLSAEELFGSALEATELVVLSACSSGVGADAESQGLLGLRSALLAGGARKLVLSLWNVDDKATGILMSAFYRELWSTGGSVVAALQKAQSEVRSIKQYRAPKYWAGWVVVDPD